MDEETLIVRVINSMPVNDAVIDSVHTGIGLKNVRERLAIQFGGRASCHSGRTDNNQWRAELRLPMLHSAT